MLYLYSLLNLSSVMLLNDFLQNAIASSIERPKTCKWMNDAIKRASHCRTLRKSPYCNLPKCFKWRSLTKHSCKFRIHIGKCFLARSSIMSARISSPVAEGFAHSDGTPVRNPWDRLFNIGINLVSSSMRGSILAVCCAFSGTLPCDRTYGESSPRVPSRVFFQTR